MGILKYIQNIILKVPNIIIEDGLQPLNNKIVTPFIKFIRENKTFSMSFIGLIVYIILTYTLAIKYDYFGYNSVSYITNILFIFIAVGFAGALVFKYYNKEDSLGEKSKTIFKRYSIILFCICLALGLIYLISYASFYNDLFSIMFMLTGAVFALYLINKQLNQFEFIKKFKQNKILSIIYHIIFLIPCFIFDGTMHVFSEFKNTPKSIFNLLLFEALIVILYFVIPYLVKRFYTRDSKVLLNKPIYLNNQRMLISYEELTSDQDKDENKDEDTVDYNYGLSSWIYIDNYGSNYNYNSDQFIDILNYGDKPAIQYNNKLNTLRIISKQGVDHEEVIYETDDFALQRWNHFVINYDNGNIDVFINNKLVGTKQGVLPYMKYDNIISGEIKGIPGGICNVKYYYNPMTKLAIDLEYSTLKDKTPPIL